MSGIFLDYLVLTVVYLFKGCIYLFILLFSGVMACKAWTEYYKRMCTCTAKLHGKTVIVTGGNAGIGYETARLFALRGANVVIASRNAKKSQEAVAKLKASTSNPNIVYMTLDLSSLTDVRRFVEEFNRTHDRLDILINNAGFNNYEQTYTEDGIEKIMHVNHVGPSYLTHLLIDKLKASAPSRIVFVASEAHKGHVLNTDDVIGKTPHNCVVRYANSKICNILSARALARRLPDGVTAYSVHPGTTGSDIWETCPSKLLRSAIYFLLQFFKTPEECSQTTIHVALAPSEPSGRFFDECAEAKPASAVNDELADIVWDNTMKLINQCIQKDNAKSI